MARSFKSLAAVPVIVLALIALIGCARGRGELEGTQWRLTEWTLGSLNPRDFQITAEFSDGTIGGRSGVNTYGGPYTLGSRQSFKVERVADFRGGDQVAWTLLVSGSAQARLMPRLSAF